MVCRVERNRNYTTMSNYHLRDKNLSFKAKGLLSMCLSLPDCWDYSIEGLAAISKEGQTAVMNTIKELEEAGYIRRERTRQPDGRLGKVEYIIYEHPQKDPHAQSAALEETAEIRTDEGSEEPHVEVPELKGPDMENPQMEEPHVENPHVAVPDAADTDMDHAHVDATHVENRGQIITDKLNTEEINNRERERARTRYGICGNVILTDQELSDLEKQFPNDCQHYIDRLSEYMAMTGKNYRSHYATICKWAREDTARAASAEASSRKGSVPYGSAGLGQHEMDAVRRLQKKHQEAAAS